MNIFNNYLLGKVCVVGLGQPMFLNLSPSTINRKPSPKNIAYFGFCYYVPGVFLVLLITILIISSRHSDSNSFPLHVLAQCSVSLPVILLMSLLL